MYYYNDKNNELFHYGVKGMKWGVRRYQNSDGTLNAEGKKKYYVYDRSWDGTKTYRKKSRRTQAYEKAYEDSGRKNNQAKKAYNASLERDRRNVKVRQLVAGYGIAGAALYVKAHENQIRYAVKVIKLKTKYKVGQAYGRARKQAYKTINI